MAEVSAWVDAHADASRLAFVGSSLGGFYATWLAERYGARAVLINPSVRPFDDLAAWKGVQTNLYTGEAFEVTDAHFAELRALYVEHLADPARYFLLVQSGDEVLDWRTAVARYAGGWQYVEGGGDHSFAGFERHLPEILRFADPVFSPVQCCLCPVAPLAYPAR
jgi:predicted esterase YcpF (UPF0227 family)